MKVDYAKEEGRRDDWLQCLVGAEIVAVPKGLDKLSRHREDAAPRSDAAPRTRRKPDSVDDETGAGDIASAGEAGFW